MPAKVLPQEGDNIFLYGTLRPGERAFHIIGKKAEHLGRTVLPNAAIFSLGAFPGLKLEDKSTVTGDIFKVTDKSLFTQLDQYEGYPHMYDRVMLDTQDGPAWTYVFQGEVHPDVRIVSGDWKQRGKL